MGFFDIFSAPKWSTKAKQPTLINRATRDRVVLHITWATSSDDLPMGLNGSRLAGVTRGPELIGEDWHAYVTCLQPDDFNDFDHLETLGHECWHALGAMHTPD